MDIESGWLKQIKLLRPQNISLNKEALGFQEHNWVTLYTTYNFDPSDSGQGLF